jgi:hypothetical protein
MRIRGTDALRQYILDSGRFKYRSHRTTRDNASSFGGRLQKNFSCAKMSQHLVRDGPVHDWHLEHILLGLVSALPNRFGDLVRLAKTGAHFAAAIADDDESAEAEAATTLHNFCYAVDMNDALFNFLICFVTHFDPNLPAKAEVDGSLFTELALCLGLLLVAFELGAAPCLVKISALSSICYRKGRLLWTIASHLSTSFICHDRSLKLQAALARTLCQGLYAPMIDKAAAIKDDLIDLGVDALLGDQLADEARLLRLLLALERRL